MPVWLLPLLPYLPQIIDSVINLVEDLIFHKRANGENVSSEERTLAWLDSYKKSTPDERAKLVSYFE